MKKIAVITTSKELKEFQERTDIRILDINVRACDQTWATQEYFVATIVYDDDLSSDPDYWTRLEHQYAGMAMQSYVSNNVYLREIREMCKEPQEMRDLIADLSILLATTLVQKLKEKEERK